jgi:hypothetical protein
MAQGRQLTIEQKEQIQGVFFAENIFFNCVQDINDEWFIFLSEDDLNNIEGYQWLIDLPLSEYLPKIIENPLI